MSENKQDLEKRVDALEARIFDLDLICALMFNALVGDKTDIRDNFIATLRDISNGISDDRFLTPDERTALSNNSFHEVAAKLVRHN